MNKAFAPPNPRFILTGCISWTVSALVLSLLTALIMSLTDIPESAVGYICSALSFVAAFIAGLFAMRNVEKGAMLLGLFVGMTVTVVALTLGFLLSDTAPEPDGVLSVVTFSLSGALAGSVMCPKRKRKHANKPVKARRHH